MKNFISALILFSAIQVYSQIDPSVYGNSITESDAKNYMEVLASDALEGRLTGSRGQKMAAAFIASSFKDDGLFGPSSSENPYYYEIPFESKLPGNTYIKHNGLELRNLEDIAYWGTYNYNEERVAELIAIGNANENILKSFDLRGKAVIVTVSGGFQKYRSTAAKLYEKGASLVLMSISESGKDFNRLLSQFRSYFESASVGLKSEGDQDPGIVFISPSDTYKLLNVPEKAYQNAMIKSENGDPAALKKIKPTQIRFNIETIVKEIISENVVGFIEGSELPDQVLVITAHYDHLGKKGNIIYYGADDNGSGTAALMEVAQAFGLAAKDGYYPKRSILFMALTGEEEGLLGSEYYTMNPLYPLANTIVNLNMDMVGHLDDAHPDDPNFVSVVGSDWLSSDLHEIHENANEKYVGLELDYTYNAKDHPERFYYRSDQYNFAKHGIPVIFYTSGDHEDYHKPTDTKENIKYERIEKVARLVFYTAWGVANREETIKVVNN